VFHDICPAQAQIAIRCHTHCVHQLEKGSGHDHNGRSRRVYSLDDGAFYVHDQGHAPSASARLIAVGLAVGLPVGVLSAVGLAWLLGASPQTILSLAPKSVTAGIAVGISEQIGGLQTLTIVLVIMTGITGAVLGPIVARLARIDDPRVVGLTMGIASHGIGTARALQINEVAGAFSGLGMGLNRVLTAILLPLIFGWF
jgi:putative effector of murein hydrolase